MKISPAARTALRTAITNHADWNTIRKANGYSLATMSRDDYLIVSKMLSLDVEAVVREANNADAARTFDACPVPTVPREGVRNQEELQAAERAARREATNARVNAKDDGYTEAGPDAFDKMRQLHSLIASIAGNSVDANQVREIADKAVQDALREHGTTVRIELTRQGAFAGTVTGHQHPKFATLLIMATARDANGFVPPVWITGPAGSGKTFAVKQIAKTLDTEFRFNGAIGMAHELLGFIDANGVYHRTPFRDAYEHGYTYVFDEVDGSDNSALLALNAALANNVASFPDGLVERHPDCRIFATANTWGFGSTADYVGRSKIDAAFLNRFAKIDWPYDNELEQNICGNPAFARRVQRARGKAQAAGLKIVISPRASIFGASYIAAGMTENEAAELTYLAGLSDDQKAMIA